ncbi:hypothetical protein BD408DRAFT_406952 [Parasitella parasitica]|nr:hypothetical protein BD408DRAFT_406952 [Parasitella parasitica]
MDTAAESESHYASNHLDNIVKVENTMMEESDLSEKEWDAGMELALLNAISRCKPVGDFYGMSALDELEEEDEEQEEEEREEQEKRKGDIKSEFSLPLDDYEQLISEHRQDDQSVSSMREESDTAGSPILPPTKRIRSSKRDSSPTNSVADSITSNNTPEPEEGKPPRKSSRANSKSTPEPANRNGGRRAGRSASNASTTNNRGNKRQTKRK